MLETRTPRLLTWQVFGSKTSTPKYSSNQRSLLSASSPLPDSAPACPQARVMFFFQRPVTQAMIGLVKPKVRSLIQSRAIFS